MGDKHAKKTQGPGPANGQDTAERGSPELREQIAALAEQVRRLSTSQPAAPAAVAAAPVPPTKPPHAEPARARAELVAADVIAMTERAAAQIRESAEREAERIRARRCGPTPAAVTELRGALRRQGAALAALAAEVELLETSAEILRGQLRVLEAELAQTHEILDTL